MIRNTTLSLTLLLAAIAARAGTTASPMPVPDAPAGATEAQCKALKAGMKLVREVALRSFSPEGGAAGATVRVAGPCTVDSAGPCNGSGGGSDDGESAGGIHGSYFRLSTRFGRRDTTLMEGWRDYINAHGEAVDPLTGRTADCSKVKKALPVLMDEHKKMQAKVKEMVKPCTTGELQPAPNCRGDVCEATIVDYTPEGRDDKILENAVSGACGKALTAALEQWGKLHKLGVNPYGNAERGSNALCRAGQNGYRSFYDLQKQTGERQGSDKKLIHTTLGLKEQADKLHSAWTKHLNGARRGVLRRGINAAQTPLMDAQRAFYARHTRAGASDASMIQAGINAAVAAKKLTETYRANCRSESQCMLFRMTMGAGGAHHRECVSQCPAGSHAGVPGADGSSICVVGGEAE